MTRVYFGILALLFIVVISIPYLIKNTQWPAKSLLVEDEIAAGLLVGFLFILGFFISTLYRKELERRSKEIDLLTTRKNVLEDRLADAFSYIGEVNIQLLEIKSIFTSMEKYPENNKDFKYVMRFFALKALGIVNVDWVVIRVIDPTSLRTLGEYGGARGNALLQKHEISNKALVVNDMIEGCSVVGSNQDNLTIKAFCVLPIQKLTDTQTILLKAIVNQLEMLFVIFTSPYYKESCLIKSE